MNSFKDFLDLHKKIWPNIIYKNDVDCAAMVQLARIWNSRGILEPEKCSDIVVIDQFNEKSFSFNLIPNPYISALQSNETKDANKTKKSRKLKVGEEPSLKNTSTLVDVSENNLIEQENVSRSNEKFKNK